MPPPRTRGRRDADDREGNRRHRSPSAVAEPRLEDMQNRFAALRNRLPRNMPAASTAVELNQRQEIGEHNDYFERYLKNITAPTLRYAARIARNRVRNAKEQMEVDSVDSVSSSEEEEEDEEEEEEEVDVVN